MTMWPAELNMWCALHAGHPLRVQVRPSGSQTTASAPLDWANHPPISTASVKPCESHADSPTPLDSTAVPYINAPEISIASCALLAAQLVQSEWIRLPTTLQTWPSSSDCMDGIIQHKVRLLGEICAETSGHRLNLVAHESVITPLMQWHGSGKSWELQRVLYDAQVRIFDFRDLGAPPGSTSSDRLVVIIMSGQSQPHLRAGVRQLVIRLRELATSLDPAIDLSMLDQVHSSSAAQLSEAVQTVEASSDFAEEKTGADEDLVEASSGFDGGLVYESSGFLNDAVGHQTAYDATMFGHTQPQMATLLWPGLQPPAFLQPPMAGLPSSLDPTFGVCPPIFGLHPPPYFQPPMADPPSSLNPTFGVCPPMFGLHSPPYLQPPMDGPPSSLDPTFGVSLLTKYQTLPIENMTPSPQVEAELHNADCSCVLCRLLEPANVEVGTVVDWNDKSTAEVDVSNASQIDSSKVAMLLPPVSIPMVVAPPMPVAAPMPVAPPIPALLPAALSTKQPPPPMPPILAPPPAHLSTKQPPAATFESTQMNPRVALAEGCIMPSPAALSVAQLSVGKKLVFDWPPTHTPAGQRIKAALDMPDTLRHDILMPEAAVFFLLLMHQLSISSFERTSGATIVACAGKAALGAESEVPPGCTAQDRARLVVIVGEDTSIESALRFIPVIAAYYLQQLEVLRVDARAAAMVASPAVWRQTNTHASDGLKIGQRLVVDFPSQDTPQAAVIREAMALPLAIRHDMLVPTVLHDRLNVHSLQATGTRVVICSETPPGCSKLDPFYLVVLVGAEASIRKASLRILSMLSGGLQAKAVEASTMARMAVRTGIMINTVEMMEPLPADVPALQQHSSPIKPHTVTASQASQPSSSECFPPLPPEPPLSPPPPASEPEVALQSVTKAKPRHERRKRQFEEGPPRGGTSDPSTDPSPVLAPLPVDREPVSITFAVPTHISLIKHEAKVTKVVAAALHQRDAEHVSALARRNTAAGVTTPPPAAPPVAPPATLPAAPPAAPLANPPANPPVNPSAEIPTDPRLQLQMSDISAIGETPAAAQGHALQVQQAVQAAVAACKVEMEEESSTLLEAAVAATRKSVTARRVLPCFHS